MLILIEMSQLPKYTTYLDIQDSIKNVSNRKPRHNLPKYVSYWYVQDSIKKAIRACMYYGTNSHKCKKAWHDVDCVESYFNDKFKKTPLITKKDADLCKDSYGKDNHDGGGV